MVIGGDTLVAARTEESLSEVVNHVRADYDFGPGAHISVDDHTVAIFEAIVAEIDTYATAGSSTQADKRFATALETMRRLPLPKSTVQTMDNLLFGEAVKALSEKGRTEREKDALVAASLYLGVNERQFTLEQKIERLYEARRSGNTAVDGYIHRIMPAASAEQFIGSAMSRPEKGQSNVRQSLIAGVTGAVVLTCLSVSPALAQESADPNNGVVVAAISAPLDKTSQTISTVSVAVSPEKSPVAATNDVIVGNTQAGEQTVEVKVEDTTATITKATAAQSILAPSVTPEQKPAVVTVAPSVKPVADSSTEQQVVVPHPTQATKPPEAVVVSPSDTITQIPPQSSTETAPPIVANAPDTTLAPKTGETVQQAIARVAEGRDASKLTYMIRSNYGGQGLHAAPPNETLSSTIDAFTAGAQAKIIAANHSDDAYTNNAITALGYLDAVANDPTILSANNTAAKDAQNAIAAFASTGEAYHDKLLAQALTNAKQVLTADAAGKFNNIDPAYQPAIENLYAYATLAEVSDADQNAQIQKIKDDEAAAAKAAAEKAAADAAAKAAADEAARRAAEAATTNSPDAQALQEMINTAGTPTEKRIYTAFQYFMNNGFTADQAAGIIGNLLVESAGTMDPTIKQGEGGPGRGIAQWGAWATDAHGNYIHDAQGNKILAGRFTLLVQFAQSQGKNWDDLGVQLDFIMHEFQTTRAEAFAKVKAAQDAHDATYAFMRWFEGPRDQSEKATTTRMNRGLPVLNTFTTNVNQVNQERAAANNPENQAKAICDSLGIAYAGPADGWSQGEKHGIYLCEIPAMYWQHSNEPMQVNVDFAATIMTVLQKAHAAGDDLRLAQAYRSSDQQKQARIDNGCPDMTSPSNTCKVAAAAPLNWSNHQMGNAVDFANVTPARFNLIQKIVDDNKLQIKNFALEKWHWSVDGS